MSENKLKTIAIFASGSGTNAEKIMDHFSGSSEVKIGCVVCNNPKAGVIGIAEKRNIPVIQIDKTDQANPIFLIAKLKEKGTDLIVLSGYLWLIPPAVIKAFPGRIINIHPALLPRFGGKGMYGMRVHEAVLAAGEKESGITIHIIDEEYDRGDLIFQARCPVESTDTPQSLALKIRKLEHTHFAPVIEDFLKSLS